MARFVRLKREGEVTRAYLPSDWHVLMFQHQAKNTIQLMGEWQE